MVGIAMASVVAYRGWINSTSRAGAQIRKCLAAKKNRDARNRNRLIVSCSTFHKKCQIVPPASGPVTFLADAVHDIPRCEFLVAQRLAVERIDRHPAAAERRQVREGPG